MCLRHSAPCRPSRGSPSAVLRHPRRWAALPPPRPQPKSSAGELLGAHKQVRSSPSPLTSWNGPANCSRQHKIKHRNFNHSPSTLSLWPRGRPELCGERPQLAPSARACQLTNTIGAHQLSPGAHQLLGQSSSTETTFHLPSRTASQTRISILSPRRPVLVFAPSAKTSQLAVNSRRSSARQAGS